MKKQLSLAFVLLLCFQTFSQKNQTDYNFGHITNTEMKIKVYEKDTTANALVLYEHGYTDFAVDKERYIIRTTFYKKIKIFNTDGYNKATVNIYLYKGKASSEKVRNIKGVSHGPTGSRKYLSSENIYKTNYSEKLDQVSFTLPNIEDGTIIEYTYTIDSPYFFDFTGWDFQEDIPKLESVFKASIPGNFVFNRELIGTLKLSINESGTKKNCFDDPYSAGTADCEELTYAMKDIPAFIEEDYMTAKENFMSRIEFEMSKYLSFTGDVKEYTTTWKAVDKDYKNDNDIGRQLKRKDYFEKSLPTEILEETDYLKRAKKVYSFIQNHYAWNEKYRLFDDMSVKKAFKEKTGTIGEINMSLINALNASGIETELVLLSTRENGYPTKRHPVITDFNYIIAKIEIDDKIYFLDATDKSLPFGVLPFRCLNRDARVMDFKNGSYWTKIEPSKDNVRKITMLLDLTDDGTVEGGMRISNSGYFGMNQRNRINRKSEEDYLNNLEDTNDMLEIVSYTNTSLNLKEKLLKEDFEIILENDDAIGDKLYLNPFFVDQIEENPFKLESRQYPVDFGYSRKFDFRLTLVIPDGYEVESLPEKKAMKLPNDGGYFTFQCEYSNYKIRVNFKYSLNKPYFYSNEYVFLKELFKQMIQTQNEPIVLKKVTEGAK